VAHSEKKEALNDSDSDELDLKEDVEAAVIPSESTRTLGNFQG
jgi:hypothetical protein